MSNVPSEFQKNIVLPVQGAELQTDRLSILSVDELSDLPKSPKKKPQESSLVLHDPDRPESQTNPVSQPKTESQSKTVEKLRDWNQRQFARCPVDEEQTLVMLNLNGRDYDCRLVELSIGGFGVITSRRPTFPDLTVGVLRTPDLSFIVSVTHREMREDGTYIGLRQIEEIVKPGSKPIVPSSFVGNLIAGLACAFILATAYCLMSGM